MHMCKHMCMHVHMHMHAHAHVRMHTGGEGEGGGELARVEVKVDRILRGVLAKPTRAISERRGV